MRYAQYFGSYGGRRYFRGAGRRQRRHRRREYLRPAADGLSGNGLHDRYRLLGGGFDPLVAVEDPGGPPERHAGDGVRDGGDLAAVFGDSAFPRPDGCVAGGFGASAAVGEGLFVVVYSGIGFPDVDGRRTFRYPFGRGAKLAMWCSVISALLNVLLDWLFISRWGEGPCVRSFGGWHRPGGSDCLPKTQVHAKAKAAVYALTPARCRKVKRIRQLFGAKR